MCGLGHLPARYAPLTRCGMGRGVGGRYTASLRWPPLAGCTGLLDPCEKGMVDSAAVLSAQERANITLSAQVSCFCCVGGAWELGVMLVASPARPEANCL